MPMDEDDERVLHALYNAGGPTEQQIVEALQSWIIDKIHEYGVSDGVFHLLTKVFSEDTLLKKKGIISFFGLFIVPWDLSGAQKKRIVDTFLENYDKYEEIEMCWIICDFIARNCDIDESISMFGSLFKKASPNGKEGVKLGLDILARTADERQLEKIVSILKPA